jgi:hypothetical protein
MTKLNNKLNPAMKFYTLLAFILLGHSASQAQLPQFAHRRQLSGIINQWHKLILPADLYAKAQTNFTDLRIMGITPQNDTIFAPYILQSLEDIVSEKVITCTLLNQSKNEKGYFFTYQVPDAQEISQIKLDFKQTNFNWFIVLEGSQNQQEWFTILNNYRLVSIQNDQTNYKFTELNFPNSKYKYLRILVKSNEQPEITDAILAKKELAIGTFRNYPTYIVSKTQGTENKKEKQTIVHLDLKSTLPVSRLKIFAKNGLDYYRPLRIEYLTDSVNTPRGWVYNYNPLATGTINSLGENEFGLANRGGNNSTLIQKIKITIENHDDAPLLIDSIIVSSCVQQLVARFTQSANYYLVYGNQQISAPTYDIANFRDKIPTNPSSLSLMNEQTMFVDSPIIDKPFFQNKAWLWGIMTAVIGLLGWFSLKMIKKMEH